MKVLALALITILLQDITYKPKEEFEIKLDYQFKQRTLDNPSSAVHLNETRREHERRTSTDQLPYLILKIKMLKLAENEVRVRIVNNLEQQVYNKKIDENTVIALDMGFTADIKDRVKPYEYSVMLLSPDKTETSRIFIQVEADGSFLVNGEKRGRF
jgi:hypothetical protein